MTKKTDQTKLNGKTSGKWHWVLIVMVLSLAAVGYFNSEHFTDIPNRVETDTPENEKLVREVKAVLQETDRKNREAYAVAVNELRDEIKAAFDCADEGVEPALDELVSFKGCAILCYYFAKDKFNGTFEAEERINSVLEMHIGKDVLEANQRVENAFVRFNDTLARNMTDMKVKLASTAERVLESENEKAQSAFKNFIERLNTVSGSFKGITYGTLFPAAGLAVSGFMVKPILGQATRVLGPIASRLGVTTALSIGVAAADGPLPILDAIGLLIEGGGMLWCGYELYNAQVTLREKVEGELRNALAQYRGEVFELGKKRSVELLKAYNDQNVRIVKNLTKQLS